MLEKQQSEMGFMADIEPQKQALTLADRFIVPPFSVLDARQGYWQDRKRAWLALGIQSEIGRGDAITFGITPEETDTKNHAKAYTEQGKKEVKGLLFRATGFAAEIIAARGGGTSIFDPVLCELAYRWFCPNSGHILDPFAGGSVRGIVAGILNYKYTGIEIRKEQIEANEQQARQLGVSPKYILGKNFYKISNY